MNIKVSENIISKLKTLPEAPGCYIMKNVYGRIIYVGKSKCLKNRVRSYFQAIDKKDSKIQKLVYNITDFDIIVMDSELDALLLECCLIKKHLPEYNTLLKPSKHYPFLRIHNKDSYPKFKVTNTVQADGAKYYGSFYSYYDAVETLEFISSIWKIPCCHNKAWSKNSRACINYHLGKCYAPCERLIEEEQYRKIICEVIDFLEGRKKKITEMNKKMKLAVQELEFEQAAVLRDNLNGLRKLSTKLERFNVMFENSNVYVFMRPYGEEEMFSLFHIVDGKLTERFQFNSSTKEEFRNTIVLSDNNGYNENSNEWLNKIEKWVQSDDWDNIEKRLPQCIAQIGANKLFVTIKRKMRRQGIEKILLRKFDLFFK